jgi:hypothetical protein
VKIIKVSCGDEQAAKLFLRQTPGGLGIWEGCHFVINKPIDECDWWVVCHGSGIRDIETTFCDPKHIVYISMEPEEIDGSIKNGFLNQFSKLILCDRSIVHPDITYKNGLTWWVGMKMEYRSMAHHFLPNYSLDFDILNSMSFPEKTNRISVIVSNKTSMVGHKARLIFLEKLMTYPVAEYIDIYGGGFNAIPDKWDVIAPYKFHLVLENDVKPNYWTEKLADAFLGFSFPIYHGCPNVFDYFPKDSLLPIDINDVDKTAANMLRLINGNQLFEYNKKSIEYSRRKVLQDYNIFQMMSDACNEPAKRKVKCKLKPKRYFTGSLTKRIVKNFLSPWY